MTRVKKTRYVILGLLTEAPKTGYVLKQEIDEVIGHFWNESYGQIYPVLRELWESGLAERRSDPAGGRVRYVYSITAAGRAELSRWLSEPPEPEVVRNEMLLKLFFGASTDPSVLRGHVRAFRRRAEGLAAMLEQVERGLAGEPATNPSLAYWRMTVRAGELIARARGEWAAETLAALDALAAAGASSGDGNGGGG